MRFERTRSVCATCGHRGGPADQTLDLEPCQRSSAPATRGAAWLGGLTPFREAARLLAERAGVVVGSATRRPQAEQQGPGRAGDQQAQSVYVRTEQEPWAGTVEPAPGRLVVETDGVCVRYRCPPDGPHTWHAGQRGRQGGPRRIAHIPASLALMAGAGTSLPRYD